MEQNKTGKYLKYAIGEIFLVVIGILIALQINNWNDQRIEKDQLNGLLQSISNGVKSDIRELNLLSTARASISAKIDSIFSSYIPEDKKFITPQESSFINYAFTDASNTVSFNPNLSTFEALTNSSFYRNIQGSDLSLLLNAYLATANKIKKAEEKYHDDLENNRQEWSAKIKNSEQELFMLPWLFTDENSNGPSRFLEILRAPETVSIFFIASFESAINPLYEEQILMGKKLIEMIENSQTAFDEQTKLDFSGILYSFADADYLSVLIKGEVPTGFDIRYAASGLYENHFSNESDYLVMEYPENKYAWGAPYFWVNALNGRVNEMDFSDYSKMIIEMKGDVGGETFEIVMKDKNDPPDGSESRISMELTKDWNFYEINTAEFITADMKTINMPLGFVFQGSEGKEIHVRSVQFRKD